MRLLLVAAVATSVAANCLGRCGIALNIGNVGSCAVFGCSTSRGPTVCEHGVCMCHQGYCRYPVTTMHVQSRTCRMRAGTDSCHATRFCYNAGFFSSSCSGGLCFCKVGYMYNCHTKKCVWIGHSEGLSEEELSDIKADSNRESFLNVLQAGLWVCACVALSSGAALAWRSRSRKVQIAQE